MPCDRRSRCRGSLCSAQTAERLDIYSVATSDPGDSGDKKDLGPFRSAVYLDGTLRIVCRDISFAPPKTKKIVHWSFDGLEVEAIAEPAKEFNGAAG
jgi:hypothetical protein